MEETFHILPGFANVFVGSGTPQTLFITPAVPFPADWACRLWIRVCSGPGAGWQDRVSRVIYGQNTVGSEAGRGQRRVAETPGTMWL